MKEIKKSLYKRWKYAGYKAMKSLKNYNRDDMIYWFARYLVIEVLIFELKEGLM